MARGDDRTVGIGKARGRSPRCAAVLQRLPNSLKIGKVIPFRKDMANDSGEERPNSDQAQSIGFAARSQREESDGA